MSAVRSEFAFLSVLGFRERTADATYVRFEAEHVFVEVYHGRRSYALGVEIGRSVEFDDEEVEQKFHISDILPILTPDAAYRPTTARDRKQVARFMKELAPLVETLLVQILKDKDTVFARLSEGLVRRSDAYLEGVVADQLRTRASDAWRAKDLATVMNAYEEIESDLISIQLSDSEIGRLEYARKRLNPARQPRTAARPERLVGVVATVTASYDEGAIKARLDAADVSGQVRFASACAERVFPLYELFTDRTGQGDPALLRDALDQAWAVRSGAAAGADVEHLREAVEGLVPDDDQPDFSVWSPLAQHAAAAVAYALRLWLSGESQNGVWAARQLFEVADYVHQLDESGNGVVDGGEPVALALGGIESALAGFATGDRTVLRDAAATDGQRLRRLASNGPLG